MRAIILIAFGFVAAISAAPQYGYGYVQPPTALASDGSHHGGDKYLPPATTTPTPLVHKQFYTVSAPDENENQPKSKHLVLGRPQRNYRVIFIKAPASDHAKIKYSAEYAPQVEKTVIYVLSKKDNELDATDIATPPPSVPNKPEVFFIKYKTPEEADAAQSEIQNEYAKLGGTNEFSDESMAPLASVVGSLDGLTPAGSYNYQAIASPPNSQEKSVISQYLPPVIK